MTNRTSASSDAPKAPLLTRAMEQLRYACNCGITDGWKELARAMMAEYEHQWDRQAEADRAAPPAGASSDALLPSHRDAAQQAGMKAFNWCGGYYWEKVAAAIDAALAEYDRLRVQSSVATEVAAAPSAGSAVGGDVLRLACKEEYEGSEHWVIRFPSYFGRSKEQSLAEYVGTSQPQAPVALDKCMHGWLGCTDHGAHEHFAGPAFGQQASGVAAVDDARVEGTPAGLEAVARWIEAGCFDADRMSVRRIMAANVRQFKNITTAQPQPATAEPPKVTEAKAESGPVAWRCFHCDDVFTNHDEALAHFGTNLGSESACKIDAAEYRRMEETVRRCNAEDTDKDREIYAMRSQHALDLRREEEKGYARGMEDMRKELAAPAAPERAEGQRVTVGPPMLDLPIVKFLLGEEQYEGKWFGDHVPGKNYWWRSVLRKALTDPSIYGTDGLKAVVREGETKPFDTTSPCGDPDLTVMARDAETGEPTMFLRKT